MKYYVPVGRGGLFFRVGMALNGTMGSLVYWRASRRRGQFTPTQPFSLAVHTGSTTRRPEAWSAIATVFESRSIAEPVVAVAAIDH
jgi:hypothetical protein